MQQYHSSVGDKKVGNDNLQWMSWFIDLEIMLKCIDVDRLGVIKQLLISRQNSKMCLHIGDAEMSDWNREVDKLLMLLDNLKKSKGSQAARIELSGILENVVYILSNAVMLNPIIIALHFL